MLLDEPASERILNAVSLVQSPTTSPLAVFETVAVLMSRKAMSRGTAEELVTRLFRRLRIDVVPISGEIGRGALAAFERYGKGRGHPAQLNMGDCFAYACAKALGVPLLYSGNDFALTDLA